MIILLHIIFIVMVAFIVAFCRGVVVGYNKKETKEMGIIFSIIGIIIYFAKMYLKHGKF